MAKSPIWPCCLPGWRAERCFARTCREHSRAPWAAGSELAYWLPRALPDASLAITIDADSGSCRASYADGELPIEWRSLAPRQIALLRVPQLEVRFTYSGLELAHREAIQT